jgi:hypothetical protein
MLLSAGFTCMWPLELHLRSTWIGRDVELKVRELLCDSVIHSKILPENSSPPPFHPHISRKVLVSSACLKASPVSQCKFPAEARWRVCRPLTAASGVGFGSLLPSSVRWWRSEMVPPPPMWLLKSDLMLMLSGMGSGFELLRAGSVSLVIQGTVLPLPDRCCFPC